MINIIEGDLLNAKEKYIAHQANCLTTHSAGTAKNIFERFPYANTYVIRTVPDVPGTIKILGNGIDQRYIINFFGQYYPGRPKYPDSKLDGIQARKKYFYQCLLEISKIPDLESIAFPYGVNCNLAGGNWETTLCQLNNFEQYVRNKFGVKVCLYRKNNV